MDGGQRSVQEVKKGLGSRRRRRRRETQEETIKGEETEIEKKHKEKIMSTKC